MEQPEKPNLQTKTAGSKLPLSLVWGMFIVIVAVPTIAWLENNNFSITNPRTQLIGLLGILGYSIMWTHYSLGALRITYGRSKDQLYSRISHMLVFLIILLHPILIYWQAFDVLGELPPFSVYGLVASSMKIFVFMGTVALALFLSFDVLERFKKNSFVARNWKWVSLSQVFAMTLIFFHGLALGGTLDIAWFEFYWVCLGALLIPCFGIILRSDFTKK